MLHRVPMRHMSMYSHALTYVWQPDGYRREAIAKAVGLRSLHDPLEPANDYLE